MSFQRFNLSEHILRALKEKNYSEPTPIQEQAIPIVLKRQDIMGCAQTGTGKTAAFAIPIIELIQKIDAKIKGRPVLRSLIVTPTRELAIQIEESFKDYGKYTFLKYAVVFGGVNQNPQVDKLRRGVNVLVATPGRLLDLINQGHISLDEVRLFVLDEADRMLDMGFINDINKIIALLPKKRQSLFFSATMPPNIVKLANKILRNPKKVEITPASSTADTVQQEVYFTNKNLKNELLLHILEERIDGSALVFTRTKHGADRVAKLLNRNNVKASAIHGNKSQNARQKALNLFKDRKLRVLVATDIAARGIDIEKLQYVINYEIPNIAETYVHRIGRSGRAGEEGLAISLCHADENAFVHDIQKLIGKEIPEVSDHPFSQTDKPMTAAEKKQFEKDKQERKRAFAEERRNRRGRSAGRSEPRSKPKEKKKREPEFKDNDKDKSRSKSTNNTSGTKPSGNGQKGPNSGPRKGKSKRKMPKSLSKKFRWPLE